MINFLLYVLHRCFSGMKNGSGYWLKPEIFGIPKAIVCAAATLLTLSVPIAYAFIMHLNLYSKLMFISISAFPIICCYALLTGRGKWVHSLEFATTWSFPALAIILGGDIITPILAYPLGEVLFNGFVRLGSKRPFIDRAEVTNDATGKTVNFWLFGREFKLPRIHDGRIRAAIAAGATALWFVNHLLIQYKPSIDIFKTKNAIKKTGILK